MELIMKIKMKLKVKYKAFMYIYTPQVDELKTPSKIIKPVFAKNPQLIPACVPVRA